MNKPVKPDTPIRLLSLLMTPNLQELSSAELMDLFVGTAKQFAECMQRDEALHELDQLQLQIVTIKEELHRKSSARRN